MELKAGYKQTDIGVIPEDWNAATIGQCLKIRHGKCQRDVVCVNGEYPILATGGEIGRASRPLYSKPSVLIGRKGTINVPCYMDRPFWSVDTLFYSEVAESSIPKFVFYQFCRINWYLHNEASGVPSLNAKTIENIQIPLPPTKAEQEAIAEALSDVDALIESLDQLIAKKRHIKQGAMQELLTGQKRLPGFSGEWVVKQIGSLLTVAHGKSQHTVVDRNGIYPILATGGQIGTAKRFLYDKPSVLIGRKGTIDKPQYMDQPFWTVDTLFYSVVFEPNNAKFLFYRFCLIDWKQYNEASGVPSLNARTIERIELKVPPYEEQAAIATILTDMDAEIAALETKLTKTKNIKQGMMHNLLTGKIRLL